MAIDPNLITTVRVGELAPAAFGLTDNIAHEVGTDLKRGTIQELITFIAPLVSAMQFEIKTFHVNSAFITANFDGTGLGTNLMLGFAICNGNNGTINKDGRVGIAYGATHNVIGQFGGSATHTLTINEMPSHSHGLPMDLAGVLEIQSIVNSGAADEGYSEVTPTGAKGGGQAHNNMQPYIVELHVMKL